MKERVVVDNEGVLEMWDNKKWNPIGPGGYIEVTKEELDLLVAESKLRPGAMYKVSGCCKNKDPEVWEYILPTVLYDDGTNPGATLYLTAATSNSFFEDGYGEFMDAIVRQEDIDNYTKTIRAESSLWGIWDGNNPIVEERKSYDLNDEVIWGGYWWKNISGETGTADGDLKLSEEDWEKIPYSSSQHYRKVIDTISYSYEYDHLSKRKRDGIEVVNSVSAEWYLGYNVHSVALFPFFLHSSRQIDSQWPYLNDIKIGGVFSLINFKGLDIYDVQSSELTYIGFPGSENYWGYNSSIYAIRCSGYTIISNCSFIGITNIDENNYNSFFWNCTLDDGWIENFNFISTLSGFGSGLSSLCKSVSIKSTVARTVTDLVISNVYASAYAGALDFTSSTEIFSTTNNGPSKEIIKTTGELVRLKKINDDGTITLTDLNA